ncbi:MAG: peptidase M28 family protein, partial [Xanthomonadales bacterium]|nr:peptidase M28 family protein [Xanthomonadales bacterium]
MKKSMHCISLVVALTLAVFQVEAQMAENSDGVITQLQNKALNSDLAWDLVKSLTSEVGPRMGGTKADENAVKWAVENMKALGFDRVWTEPVTFPRWSRNSESASVL